MQRAPTVVVDVAATTTTTTTTHKPERPSPGQCCCKGQLISKCLFEKIVWTKIPTKNLIDYAHYTCWAESIKFFVGILVQTIFSKRHFEIN
jgi:hypothetical protein